MIDVIWELLADHWISVVSAAVTLILGLSLSAWLALRWKWARIAAEAEHTEATWQDCVATMHGRVDQLEELLKHLSQRLDKRLDDLREAIVEMDSSLSSLEKPFTAVSTRCSQISQDASLNGRRTS
jgi:citrate synthase